MGAGSSSSLCRIRRPGSGRALLAGFAVLACAGSAAVAVPQASASTELNWAASREVTLPTDAGANPNVALGSVSCGAAGSCSAVGEYDDTTTSSQGLLVDESSGTWADGSEATPPSGANTTPQGDLVSVSCPAAGACVAVGDYKDSSGSEEGLVLSESSGTWIALEAKPPSDANATPSVGLSSVSCTSVGNCVAVGDYNDTSNHRQALALTEAGGSWGQAVEVSAPAAAPTNPLASLTHVSCSSPGNCTAAGVYTDTSTHLQTMLATESSGTWGTAVSPTLPTGAVSSNPYAISCSSPGNCAAVGFYMDSTSASHGLLLDESSGTWAAGTEPAVPAGGKDESVVSVSCPANGSCVAVGGYIDASNHSRALVLDQTAGVWGTGVEGALPANAAANPDAGFQSVSCASAGSCVAVGQYYDSAVQREGLVAGESAGVWRTGVEIAAPAGADTDPFVALQSVSCASARDCAASGIYHDGAGHYQGIVVSADTATPSLGLSAPAAEAVGGSIAASSTTATLAGGAGPTGSIAFTVFGPSTSPPSSCGSGGTSLGTATVSGDGSYHPATAFTPTAAGDYWWYAAYGGDTGDNAAASACGASMPETVVTGSPIPPGVGSAKLRVASAKVSGSSAAIRLACTGPAGARCDASLKLTVTEIRKGKRVIRFIAVRQTRKLVELAHASTVLASGQAKTVRLRLDATGRRLLARFRHYKARLAVLEAGKRVATRTLAFRAPERHTRRKHG